MKTIHQAEDIIAEKDLTGIYIMAPLAIFLLITGIIFIIWILLDFHYKKIVVLSGGIFLVLIGIGMLIYVKASTMLKEFKIDGNGIKFWYNGELDFQAKWNNIKRIGSIKNDNDFPYGIEILPKDYEVSAKIEIHSDKLRKIVFNKMIWYAKKNEVKIVDDLKYYIS